MTDELKENAALFALGLLEAGDSSAFASEMGLDPDLARLVDEYRSTLGLVALSAETVEPPASLRESILNLAGGPILAGEPAPVDDRIVPFPQKSKIASLLPWAIAACLGITSAGLVYRVATLQNNLDRLAAERIDLASVSLALLTPASPEQTGASGRVLWNGVTNNGVFESIELPSIPQDRIYQLWVFEKDNPSPIPAGFFNPADGQRPVLRPSRPVTNVVTVAVSLEVAGGRPQPEGPVVLVGAVGSAG